MAYLLDSDVFIQAQNMHYAFAVCPGFWGWMDDAHSKGMLFSIKDVREELMRLEDELSKWAKPRGKMFLDRDDGPTYESLKILSGWVQENYKPEAQSEFFGAADFFLVGYAHAHSHIVVTHETYAKGFKVKIPVACQAMGVPYMTTFQMLKVEGAKFTLQT